MKKKGRKSWENEGWRRVLGGRGWNEDLVDSWASRWFDRAGLWGS